MKKSFLIFFLSIFYLKYSSATLVDGVVTLSWTATGSSPVVDRFLTGNTQIRLNVLCLKPTLDTNKTQDKTKKISNQEYKNKNIEVGGRIGRFPGCLPLQSDTFMTTNQLTKDTKDSQSELRKFYDGLWDQMEVKTFKMVEVKCDFTGDLQIEEFSNITGPTLSPEKVLESRKKTQQKTRRVADETKPDKTKTPLQSAVNKQSDKNLRTWSDGYYFIELSQPTLDGSITNDVDIDVVVSMKNRFGGYITADEHPALIFYCVMCGIYALFGLLWFIWCACYWRELLKIQFWIGGVIIIGLIEKTAFIAEYETVNLHG